MRSHTNQAPSIGAALRRFFPGALALLAVFATADSLVAQVTQASYPLLTDLDDATGAYGPITLTGNSTPPPAPPNNGVCVNGIYSNTAGGQDVRTPLITGIDSNDFQLDIEFQVAALPPAARPIFVGGNGWRWIGFYIQADGTYGVLYNNANFTYSSNTITPGTWHAGTIKYEAGVVQLFLDGIMVHEATIGALVTGNNVNFTTNNFSNGTNHNGCIRNIVIANDTTLGPITPPTIGTSYCGPVVPNSTGNPAVLTATGSDVTANNDLKLVAADMPANQFGFFLTSQTQAFVMNPGGSNGHLCLGGVIGRYVAAGQIQNAGAGGTYELQLDLTQTPAGPVYVSIAAGETWNFQSWFRDIGAMGQPESNFTNGLTITFM